MDEETQTAIQLGRACVRLIESAKVLEAASAEFDARVRYGMAREAAQAQLRILVRDLPADVTAQILVASEKALGPAGDLGLN